MAQNEIEEMLDHLRRIKSGGNLDSAKIDQIEELEMVLRILRTFIKYHRVLFRDSLVKHTNNAKLTMAMLPDQCKTNLNLERLESHLLEFLERNTILSDNYELNSFDLSDYMDWLENNLNDVLMILPEGDRSDPPEENLKIHKFIKEVKIIQTKLRFLTYLYATEINGYVNHKKLECLETRIQLMANNVGQLCLAILGYVVSDEVDTYEYYDILYKSPYLLFLIVLVEFLLVFPDADVPNHVINGKWFNEVMEKVGAIVGNLEKELSTLISILEKELSSLSSIFRDVAKVTELWSADVALKPGYVIAPFKYLPTRHSNLVTDEEIVYNSDNVVSHFDVRAWCIVSQTYNRRTLLQEIFSQVIGSKDKGDKDDIFPDILRKSLMGKRYLIVLDDMWDCMEWDDLRLCFPNLGNRSRIVVTTRLEKVGKQDKYCIDPYTLPFLTTEESCKLLQKKLFQREDFLLELQDMSQAVAEKCKGLPLVVVLVAGIIKRKKMEESWWNEVKDSLFDYLESEDFVVNIKSAEDYLMDLISSNVVLVSKKEYNGKVKYCQVHDVVLHFCLEKSREEKFMLVVKGNHGQFQPCDLKESRVSFHLSKEHSKFASLGSKTRKPFHQQLRSLITIGKSFDGIPLRFWIHKLRLLKVFDLSSHEVSYLSSATLKPLNHLKYLTVWVEKFYFHPESHLPHLETLIVNNWSNIVRLLASLWEMGKFRHVEIFEAKFDKHGFFEVSSKLENLKILKIIVRFPIDRVDVLSRRWVASEESFPLFETLVIKECYNLEEIPLSFADIPTLKHIKLIRCKNKPMEALALRIKDDVKENEGNDRIDLIIKVIGDQHISDDLSL
ncbi:hypothetical protein H5410_056216 [Solanum commersonii]|uniref:NB-ARC domain-containing protein n=1 Tax=Solanum commersonii TaxID=4109 RepID=A0A9J5WKM9_SOLCO|nr:hypothetical protein H5410_056216 [Solanum commersonii]